MGNLAVHMRIANLQISNEDVDTRQAAVSELAEAWSKYKSPVVIIAKASQIACSLGGNGTSGLALAEEVERAIQNHASAFLHSERPLEVGVCAGMASMQVLSGTHNVDGWTTADIFANALWSALSYQRPLEDQRRESLRTEVLQTARARACSGAEASRTRSEVPDFTELSITLVEDAKPTSTFKKATAATINALRRNSALDREELDFLWWVQLGRSRILNRSLSKIDEPVRLVIQGIEAARQLRRFPCDVHRDLVLRTLVENPNLSLAEMMSAVAGDLEAIASVCENEIIGSAVDVFPLLYALSTGHISGDDADVSRSSSDWGARALLEAALINLSSTGPGTI